MCELLGLRKGEGRSGVDAYFDFDEAQVTRSCPIELKSTTTGSVSTARDVGLKHIEKWRSRIWVFGFYDRSGTDLERVLTLGPDSMEAWIGKVESYILPDFEVGRRAAAKLDRSDLDIIFGRKRKYALEDAQALMKRQWTASRYASEMDAADGYTPVKMLEILRLRALYLSDRGSTLNNPHTPKTFFSEFDDIAIEVRDTNERTLRKATRRRIRSLAAMVVSP